jgi:GTP-binding protein HflX
LVENRLPRPDIEISVLVPYTRGDVVARLHDEADVLRTDHTERGTLVHARVGRVLAEQLRPFATAVVP